MTQQILNALVLASVYALFGLGFNLVLGALNILNVAHAALFGVGALATYWFAVPMGAPFPIAALLGISLAGLGALVLNEFALAPLRRRGGGGLTPLIASLGASMVILTILQIASGAQIVRLPADALPDVSWEVFGGRLGIEAVIAVVLTVLSVIGTYVLLVRTKLGAAIRATEFNETAAKMVGIPTETIVRATFLVSGLLAGTAGVVTALLYNSVHFRMGEPFLLKGFVVVVLGGFGSVGGTVLAALLLAAIEVSAIATGIGSYRDAIAFALLILILMLRPAGLFRSPERARP